MQCSAQGFPSALGPNPDIAAVKSIHSAAISSNEKIFPVFAKKLASKDTKEFVNTARKFAIWLGSEKAYYADARPKIVELLEIAVSTFADTFVHHPASGELADLLQQLIQTIIPFKHLFPELELQSRLQRLMADADQSLSTVPRGTAHDNAPPQGAATANAPSHISPVNIHLQPPMLPTPSPQNSILQDATKAAPGDSTHVDVPRACHPLEVVTGQTNANPSPSLVANIPQEPSGNVSSSMPSRPQPKRIRKGELPEELIARDLDWFKTNQASPIVNGDSSKAGELSPTLSPDMSHTPGRSPSPKKTARIVPSRRLPRRVPLDTKQNAESGVSAFTLPTEETISFENGFVQNVTEQRPPSENMESNTRSTAILQACDMQEVSPQREAPSSELQPAATSSNEHQLRPEIPQTDHQSSVKIVPPNTEPFISPRPPTPPSRNILDRQSMDICTLDIGSEEVPLESPRKPESTPPQSPQALQLCSPILPPLVRAWEPPPNLNFNISQISSGQLQHSAMDTNQPRFDGEMTVIHSMQGKPFTHTHVIDINLEENTFTKISKWVNRRTRPLEAPRGVCISLACYLLPDFFVRIKLASGKLDVEALTLQTSCSWPDSNRLSLHVNEMTRHTVITLSPPLLSTSDQCVDISSLMKLGNNTLEIRQQGDLSDYLVVLHAHHPTRAQLSELEVVRTADERWKQFLKVLSARVAPGKVLDTTPASVGAF